VRPGQDAGQVNHHDAVERTVHRRLRTKGV
jgi:hypothetical protein